jgi:hypothetical protein
LIVAPDALKPNAFKPRYNLDEHFVIRQRLPRMERSAAKTDQKPKRQQHTEFNPQLAVALRER